MLFTEKKIQIRHKSLILYELPDYYGSSNSKSWQQRILQIKEDQKKAYSGQLTQGAKKRLTKAVDLMCQSVKTKKVYNRVLDRNVTHRLSYITLTVSQHENLTAREVYDKGFKQFLQWLRRSQKVNTYIWKCEVQKRGQIHYHITTPSYIFYQDIRDKWNNIQRGNGWLEDYYKLKGHYDPNSTDIHEVRKVNNLSGYLIKEFCKAIQNPNTTGKIWDCSLNLKKWGYYTINENECKNDLMSSLIDKNKVEAIPTDHCVILKMKTAQVIDVMDLKEVIAYDDFLTMIRTYKREEFSEGKKKTNEHTKPIKQ